MGKWIVIALLAIAVAVGLGAYFGDHDGTPWRDEDQAQVITTQGGETIIIQERRHVFPFPFVLFPLLFIGFVWFVIRGRWGNDGPGSGSGQREDWLREWHRREHASTHPTPEA